MFSRKFYWAITTLIGAFLLASCSVTTAPTDASSGTTGQTTDATSDLTSSTTLDDDEDEDDDSEEKQQEEAVEDFVAANFSQLRADMSVGRGEYLGSLATLLAIDEGRKEAFYAMTKNNFSQLFISSTTTTQELVLNLRQEMAVAKI